ncbi:HD-GYP domain-containing protein [Pantoea sp. At-9b]|uniref:HD-GYP domain-containing protein n=1 Tax=Pantoea sp. (strain At-9b) TaxID=592316 RepID=UPI0001B3DF49|nr:HD-GYP domain-containing protein [Pantoea sp. At-9b]ADU71074.1 metal dependent phosphohydrolase [Pantoea sp. At-9b]
MIKLITVDELRPGMFVHKLEVWWIKDKRIRNQMLITEKRQIAWIRNEGILEVWIDVDKSVQAPQKPPEPKKEIPQTPFFHEIDQAQAIFTEGKPQVLAMFNEARLGQSLDLNYTLNLVDEIAGSLTREPTALLSMARLKNHDDYTYLHSMAVCGLMISLGKKLGLDEQQQRRVGMGGLLHDVGKAAVPLEILNKPGRLTPEEMAIMRQHPIVGAQMLMEADADEDLLDITLHHHEKLDGSGYPHGLKGEEISLFSRMAAVCDVYDAVTSDRPYRKGWTPAEAMHNMLSWRGHFDTKLLQTFVRSIGIYPVGSLVRLASGRVALVVQAGEQSLLKPKVHVFWSLHAQREIKPEELDLGDSFCTDSITGAEDSSMWQNIDLNRIWALESA